MSEPVTLVTAAMSSIVLIVFIGLILFVFAQKSPGLALCLIGVFMSITAAVQACALSAATHGTGAQMFGSSPATGPMLKIAVILVLGGMGLMFLSRPPSPPERAGQPAVPPEEPTHVA